MREEIKKCLEKLQLLDLGRKGAGFIISQIHRLIPPENQFIPCLTSKFESLRENYMSLYNLRCNQKHDTLLQKRSLNERMSEEEKECYLDILRSFLKRLKILSLYSLIIIKGPVSYDKHSRSMKYKVVECMGDDRDFSGPCYLDIPRDELVPNNYVAIVKSMSPYEADNFTPGNLLPLYPLIIALPDKRTQRENMLLYHHFENKDKTFCFIDCDEGERKIGPTCEDKFLNQLYNELYQIIFFSRSQGD
ncbi:hypothetical protein H5U35_06160 [Candidatus Aerophobetes bacterium]|nr:hypothetical protein [Candidatus Aerophobetes bacterium]